MRDPAVSGIQQWCPVHWEALRASVQEHGLSHLVAQDGTAAAAMLADEIAMGNARDREGFDPLLRAWSMISLRALQQGVPIIGCPLCFVQRHSEECIQPGCDKQSAAEWTEGCVNSLREYAVELGLVPR